MRRFAGIMFVIAILAMVGALVSLGLKVYSLAYGLGILCFATAALSSATRGRSVFLAMQNGSALAAFSSWSVAEAYVTRAGGGSVEEFAVHNKIPTAHSDPRKRS